MEITVVGRKHSGEQDKLNRIFKFNQSKKHFVDRRVTVVVIVVAGVGVSVAVVVVISISIWFCFQFQQICQLLERVCGESRKLVSIDLFTYILLDQRNHVQGIYGFVLRQINVHRTHIPHCERFDSIHIRFSISIFDFDFISFDVSIIVVVVVVESFNQIRYRIFVDNLQDE